MLADAAAEDGDWLVALDQSEGRGRQGRRWVGVTGNFFGSTVVVLHPGDLPPHSLSLIAGMALADAIDAAVPNQALMLKWPNDLLLGGAKLAGILLERRDERVIVGFGINLADAPDVAERRTAHLSGAIAPQAFAPILASTMARMVGLWRSSPPLLITQAWLARAHPVGTPLAVHGDDGSRISGTFGGLEPDGSLRLRSKSGELRIVHAGDVTLG